jgi:hypothetical protein
MSPDEHHQALTALVAGLLGDFDHHLARGKPHLGRDSVAHRIAGTWLTDAEFGDLLRDAATFLQPRQAGRRARPQTSTPRHHPPARVQR